MLSTTTENQELLSDQCQVDLIKVDEQQQIRLKNTWSCKRQFFHEKIQDDAVKQIIDNPLLLTLLRLVFEETGEAPVNRAELYQQGLSILLRQWNNKHDDGNDAYKLLSLQQKEDLLSYIAQKTFAEGEYFFKQQQLEQYIAEYLKSVGAQTSATALKCQSKAVLTSMQAQHAIFTEWTKGVYAFSVLSFHEYLTAKAIAQIAAPLKLEQAIRQLVAHIADERWHQVLFLAAGMLPNADYLLLLMKHEIDSLIACETALQPFLSWLEEKSISEQSIYKPEATRAFYIEDILQLNYEISTTIDANLAFDLGYNSFYVDEHTCNLQNCRFSERQKQALQQYYTLNKLLLDCIDHARCVTASIREELKQDLFAPSTVILDRVAIA